MYLFIFQTEDESDKESDRSVSPGPSTRGNPDQHKQPAEENSATKNKKRRYQSEHQEAEQERELEPNRPVSEVSVGPSARRNPDPHKQPAGQSAPKNKKQRYQSERQEEADRRADEAYKILQTASQQDEFFIYGQHVGNELRKLSSTSYQIAKNYINNILFDAAMGKFEPDVGRSENSIPSIQLCPPPLSSSHSAPDSFSCLSAPTQSHNPQTNDLPPSDQSRTQFSDQNLLTISTDIRTDISSADISFSDDLLTL